MRDVFTGLVYINHGTTGAEIQFPFGGVRGTGNGHREAGQAGARSLHGMEDPSTSTTPAGCSARRSTTARAERDWIA